MLLVACGGPAKSTATPSTGAPAGPSDAELDTIGPCARYARDVSAPLERVERAAEEFLVTVERAPSAAEAGRAAEALAVRLDGERAALGAVRSADPELDAAHAALVAALDGLVVAVRRLGASFAAEADPQAAGRELSVAAAAWEQAASRLRVICPDL